MSELQPMNVLRGAFLAASQNVWLRERAMRSRPVRRAVARFMPGESLEDALAAAGVLRDRGLTTILTQLGENVTDASEAETVTVHYLQVLERVRAAGLDAEVSVKLTQLGLDAGRELACRVLGSLDLPLLARGQAAAEARGASRQSFEIAMLYGIQREAQERLAREGFRVRVLISYGAHWFPWYMRRLAERPGNMLFVFRNYFGG